MLVLRLAAFALSIFVAAPAPAQQALPASAPVNARAIALFERDWVLMHWALKAYDSNRDVLLSPAEAQAAASAFRRIADGDGDGRVTPTEYRRAREFILARY